MTSHKWAQTAYPIHEIIARRWSPRAFADTPVSLQTLGSLFEAARWTASSRNEQPWRFVFARQEEPTAHDRLAETLMEGNRAWARQAPVLAIVIAKTHASHNHRPNGKAEYDTGQAVAALSLQASALGLYVHQMGGFSAEKAQELLQIPDGYKPMVALAIGYLGTPEQLPPERQEQEQAPRSRRPLDELVFSGQWGQDAGLQDAGDA